MIGDKAQLAHLDKPIDQKGKLRGSFLTDACTRKMAHVALLAILPLNSAVNPPMLTVNQTSTNGEAQAEQKFEPIQAAIGKAILNSSGKSPQLC